VDTNPLEKLQQAVSFIRQECGPLPSLAMVLGSGLNPVASRLVVEKEVPFAAIPHVPASNVSGHAARLLVGTFEGRRISVLQGRMHFYEGHSLSDVVFLTRAVARAGAKVFFLTNAAGALHRGLNPGDLMLISDHLNMMGGNPLIGPNISELGTRFPDLNDLYSEKLRACFQVAAQTTRVPLHEGIYVALNGPSYETPAEVRMYRQLGGDAVGMSTVPESIALRHMGARVVGMSCITNHAAGVSDIPANHQEVLETGAKVIEPFCKLLAEALKQMESRGEI
jgi:purine-nucleoside phosphorylase